MLNSEFSKIQVLDCLKRVKFKNSQAGKNRDFRLENVKGCFELRSSFEKKLIDKNILLIDDVASTCSTLNECAEVLKKAHARHICGFVIARG